MTLYIIVAALLIAAIVAFVLLKKKKGLDNKSNKTIAPQNTSTAENIEQQPTKTAIDDHLRREIENNIRHKNYHVAEAQINTALHQDDTQHDLYLLLADVHLNQDDDLALEKLITHLQQNRLYDTVDQIIVKKEAFKVQKENQPVVTSENIATSSAIAAATTVINTVDFDNLASTETQTTSQDNSLDFSFSNTEEKASVADNSLNFDALLNNNTDTFTTESFNVSQQTETQDLTFSEPKATTEEVVTDLNFSFDEPKTTTEEVATDLNFSFDEPKATTEEVVTDLTFSFDEPKATTEDVATDLTFSFDEPKTTTEDVATDLNFSFDEPKTTTEEVATDLTFSFDEPTQSEVESDTFSSTDALIAGTALASAGAATITTTDIDPLIEQFPHLTHYDETAINLKLAKQYADLGAYDAARHLLANREHFNTEQNEMADTILERIAS